MNSSTTFSDDVQNAATKECDTAFLITKSSRRTPSMSSSSSSSSSSYFADDSPYSPVSPIRSFSGIPFSWEQLPGIPKNLISHKSDSKLKLPLPPPQVINPQSVKRFNFERVGIKKRISNDPFFAALVECTKDHRDETNGRSISDRFGFMSLSCKASCSVSESIVYVPRSAKSTSYDRIRRRSF